jgi:hypothetical protein
MDSQNEQYSEQEAHQRFEKLVDAALKTRPKTLKSMGPKGTLSQSKKKPKSAKSILIVTIRDTTTRNTMSAAAYLQLSHMTCIGPAN